jgi:hypothetical protein
MPSLPGRGNASALSSEGLAAVCAKLGVHAPEIWTVLVVETCGCGYIPDGRPDILYERHYFHRLTNGRFDDGDVSDARPGGYGATGSHQYERLTKAYALDPTAALRSTSWGIGQVMGDNFLQSGFPSVQTMVGAMFESEDLQLGAMAAFLVSSGLHRALQAHDWTSFARGYNGPNYAINRYDSRLNGEFQKFSSGVLPDLNVRATQLYLTYLGYHPGPVDGVHGSLTLSALAQYATGKKLPVRDVIDQDTVAQLVSSLSGMFATRDEASSQPYQHRPTT